MKLQNIHVHYELLRSFAPIKSESVKFYPIGIIISLSDKDIMIRSKISDHLKIYRSDIFRLTNGDNGLTNLIMSGYFSEKLLNDVVKERQIPLFSLLEDEKHMVQKIIELQGTDLGENFAKDTIERQYQKFIADISDIFDKKIKEHYLDELRGLFLSVIDDEKEKEMFRITNYLIHFISWENSFYNFYDNSIEIIGSALRKIENRLSARLLREIKAYKAYHNHINVLKRFLDKREEGKIPILSLLDWYADIKALLTKQFISVFGRKKALEYIHALDHLLTEELHE